MLWRNSDADKTQEKILADWSDINQNTEILSSKIYLHSIKAIKMALCNVLKLKFLKF